MPKLRDLLATAGAAAVGGLAVAVMLGARGQQEARPARHARAVFVAAPQAQAEVDVGARAGNRNRGQAPAPAPEPSGARQEVLGVDGPGFSRSVEEVCNGLIARGYEIVSITPVVKGYGRSAVQKGAATYAGPGGVTQVAGGYGAGWGYGFDVTDGVIVVGVSAGD